MMKRKYIITTASFFLLSIVFFVIYNVGIYFRCQDIDVRSGTIRIENSVVSLTIHKEIKVTRFSSFVRSYIGVSSIPEWRPESCVSNANLVSPHYHLHGSITALDSLMDAFEITKAPLNERVRLGEIALAMIERDEPPLVLLGKNGTIRIINEGEGKDHE